MTSTRTLAQKQEFLDIALHRIRNIFLEKEYLAFGLVIILILAVQAGVLSRGFVSVSSDEYSRILLAANWAESPYFIERYILDIQNVWQPWHFYLLGLALKIHNGDLFFTSRIVTMIFSLISLAMLYLLTRKLFNRWVALLSVLIVGLLRVHVNLSLTPMVDIIFVTFLLGFLYFFFVWLDTRADRYLLLAAVMVGVASGLRYDGWPTVAVFSVYLGTRWLIGLWLTRSLRPLWLLAIGLACLPAFIWLLGNYIYWDDPFHFLEGQKGSGYPPRGVGVLTDLFPRLPFFDMLLQTGAFICSLAIVGIMLSHRFLRYKIWLYLAFSLLLLVILISRGRIGTAYRPHYPFPYLVLLTPFCAYAIYWAITVPRYSFHHRWRTAGWGILSLICLYNLWLVYLWFSQRHSWIVICLLALVGIVLSYRLLEYKHWLYLTFSMSSLPILMLISKKGLAPGSPTLYSGLYFIFLALLYAYIIWRSVGVLPSPSEHQWQIAGSGMLIIICLFNLYETFSTIPAGMSASDIQAGLTVRQLFEEGTLTEDDKVLVEVVHRNYKKMQVLSNHPSNFVLDRSAYAEPKTGSFFLDKNGSPHEIGSFFTSYEAQVNPFFLNPPPSLDKYLTDKKIRLVIIKDSRLEAILVQQTDFKKIGKVKDYLLYFKTKPAT